MRHFKPSSVDLETGFTLVELLITIALIAILAGIAVPGFSDLVRENRLTTLTNNLNAALRLARGEAIKRNQRLALCGLIQCDGDFSTGWQLTTAIESGSILRQHRFNDRPISAVGNAPFVFNPLGESVPGSGQCLTVTVGGTSRALQVTPSGAVRSTGGCP